MVATIDGAARGNPGPAAYGIVFEDAAGHVKAQLAGRLGKATNNVAEYRALLAALAYARQQGWQALKVRTDSELLARQVQGDYKVKSADLKPLHEEAQQLIAGFDYFVVEAVSRKVTRRADKLANAALDRRSAISRQPSAKRRSPAASPEPSRRAPAAGKRTIRAVYRDGVLRPLAPLNLPDGTEVELTVRPATKG
jgi:ribonuclease HI